MGARSAADWETAILDGHRVFRELMTNNGGLVDFDADLRTLTFDRRETLVKHT